MKYLLIALLSFHLNLSAQDSTATLQVNSVQRNIGIGTNPCFEVLVPENNANELEKGFKEWMKDYDARVSTLKSGEIFADNALMKEFGNRAVDVYVRCEKLSKNESRLIIAFDIAGKFINETDHPKEYATAKNLVYQFAIRQWKQGIQKQIDAELKKKNRITEQQADLEKDIQSLKKEIEKAKERIKKAEADIEQNKGRVEEKKAELEVQQRKISELEEKLRNAR